MKLLPLLSLCALPLFLSFEKRSDALQLAPRAGSKLRKSYVHTGTQALESLTMLVDGTEHELPKESLDLSGEGHERYVFLDSYEQVADGKVAKLLRSFEVIEDNSKQTVKTPKGEKTDERERSSELSGKTVEFAAAGDGYKKSFSGEKGDEALLEGLEYDLDFAGFLPAHEVAEGDSWEVDMEAYKHFMAPGGDLSKRSGDGDDDKGKAERELLENMSGKVVATYAGAKEIEGQKVGVITIEAEIDTQREGETESEGGGSSNEVMKISLKHKGELHWSLASARAASFQIDGTGRVEIQSSTTLQRGDKSFSVQRTTVLATEGKDEVAFEPAD